MSSLQQNGTQSTMFLFTSPHCWHCSCRQIYNNPPFVREEETEPCCPIQEGGPCSKRLTQDILKVIPYWKLVLANEGRNVNVNTNGHQGDIGRNEKTGKWGGLRKKKAKEDLKDVWYHPDARAARKDFVAKSKHKFQQVLQDTKKQNQDISREAGKCMDPDSVLRVEGVITMEENECTEDIVETVEDAPTELDSDSADSESDLYC